MTISRVSEIFVNLLATDIGVERHNFGYFYKTREILKKQKKMKK